MRIVVSVLVVTLLSPAIAPAMADEFEWGPLSTQPRDNQNTIWDAHCKDSSEHVVSGQCTISAGSGTLQNVGVNGSLVRHLSLASDARPLNFVLTRPLEMRAREFHFPFLQQTSASVALYSLHV